MQGVSRTLRTSPDPHAGRLACTDCHDTGSPGQSMSSYAQRCAACHNEEYGQLAYEWARTLQRRQSAAELLLKSHEATGVKEARAKLSEAAQCGFHNLNLARLLYDRIVETDPDAESAAPASREKQPQ